MNIEPPDIRRDEMRRQMAASRWSRMNNRQRAQEVAQMFLSNAMCAKMVDQICRLNNPVDPAVVSIVEGMLGSMAQDYAETFGVVAPWAGLRSESAEPENASVASVSEPK